MKYLKYILATLTIAFMVNIANSNPLDKFVQSFSEQEALAGWVIENAAINITEQKALLIVREVYSQAYSKNVNPHMLLAVMKTESSFKSNARSKEGAVGLLQVIPRWHKDKIAGRNPYSNNVSIEVGSQILSDCLSKYNGNNRKALNCYSGNGGAKYFNTVSKNNISIKLYVERAFNRDALFASN